MAEGDRPLYCTQCGSAVHPGDNFCETCGARVVSNVLPETAPAQEPVAQVDAPLAAASAGARRKDGLAW